MFLILWENKKKPHVNWTIEYVSQQTDNNSNENSYSDLINSRLIEIYLDSSHLSTNFCQNRILYLYE